MKLCFVGAVKRVTGSCTWLRWDEKNLEHLVDCGMVQGELGDEYENNKPFPFNPSKIKFVFLTHAHLDHCGLIPRLYKEGFLGNVVCTQATAKIAKQILLDASSINAPYDESHVEQIVWLPLDTKNNFNWGHSIPLESDFFVTFWRNSHILGSVSLGLVWINEDKTTGRILFSGDIGNNIDGSNYQPLLKPLQKIDPKYTKHVVIESTYGARPRLPEGKDFEKRIDQLENVIQEALAKPKGKLVIPAFSLQRTQEILFDLYYLFTVRRKDNPIKSFDSEFLSKIVLPGNKYKEIFASSGLTEKQRELLKELFFISFMVMPLQDYERFNELLNSEGIDFQKYYKVKKSPDGEKVRINANRKELSVDSEQDVFSICWGKLFDQYHQYYNLGIKLDGLKNSEAHELINKFIGGIILLDRPIIVYTDSPLANKISKIYSELLVKKRDDEGGKYLWKNTRINEWLSTDDAQSDQILKDLFEEETLFIEKSWVTFIRRRKIPDAFYSSSAPAILISSSGMCEGGPVLKHLAHMLSDPSVTVLLTGYQSKGTNGYVLQTLPQMSDAEKKNKKIRLSYNRELSCKEIRADIKVIENSAYSGHADQTGLVDFVFSKNLGNYVIPERVFLLHGSDEAREPLREKLIERNQELAGPLKEVILPSATNKWYDLNTDTWIPIPEENTDIRVLLMKLEEMDEKVKKLTQRVETLEEEKKRSGSG